MKYKVIHRTFIVTEAIGDENKAIVTHKKYSIHLQAIDDESKIVYVDLGPENELESRIGSIWELKAPTI